MAISLWSPFTAGSYDRATNNEMALPSDFFTQSRVRRAKQNTPVTMMPYIHDGAMEVEADLMGRGFPQLFPKKVHKETHLFCTEVSTQSHLDNS